MKSAKLTLVLALTLCMLFTAACTGPSDSGGSATTAPASSSAASAAPSTSTAPSAPASGGTTDTGSPSASEPYLVPFAEGVTMTISCVDNYYPGTEY